MRGLIEKFKDWINYNRIVYGSAIPLTFQLVIVLVFMALFAGLFFSSTPFRILAAFVAAIGMPLGLWLNRKRK